MPTRLELVRALALQSGTLAGGTTLATTIGASGRAQKLVAWIDEAWEDIQEQRPGQWLWMRNEFESTLSAGAKRYTGASFGIARFRHFDEDTRFENKYWIYDADIGQPDEAPLSQVPYDIWRMKWDRRSHNQSRPVEYALSPAGEFCVGPAPDRPFAIRGSNWKSPQVLLADGDAPEMPGYHHKAIVYRAMMLMADSDESPETGAGAGREFRRRFVRLCEDQLPAIGVSRGNCLA